MQCKYPWKCLYDCVSLFIWYKWKKKKKKINVQQMRRLFVIAYIILECIILMFRVHSTTIMERTYKLWKEKKTCTYLMQLYIDYVMCTRCCVKCILHSALSEYRSIVVDFHFHFYGNRIDARWFLNRLAVSSHFYRYKTNSMRRNETK